MLVDSRRCFAYPQSVTGAAALGGAGGLGADRVAEVEERRLAARCARYYEQLGAVPRWVAGGMGARWERVEAVEHRGQMLLGIFAARGVLPLEFKPTHSVADLLVQYLDDLEHEAEEKGGIGQLVADHFARVCKVRPPQALPQAA